MKNGEIISLWEVHQKQHENKAYYQGIFLETKCNTDTHIMQIGCMDRQYRPYIPRFFAPCFYHDAGESGGKFDRQVEGGKSPFAFTLDTQNPPNTR